MMKLPCGCLLDDSIVMVGQAYIEKMCEPHTAEIRARVREKLLYGTDKFLDEMK